MKNQLAGRATEQNVQRNKLIELKETLEQKKVRLIQLNKKYTQTQNNLMDEEDKTKRKKLKVQEADALYNTEVARLAQVDKELKLVKEELYKGTTELQKLKDKEAETLAEISGAQSTIKNLSAKISKLDAERQRQQELLYAVDFQSQI